MDGVAISIIERPRPLPGHDTPNTAHNTYTLKCEEPLTGSDQMHKVVLWRQSYNNFYARQTHSTISQLSSTQTTTRTD